MWPNESCLRGHLLQDEVTPLDDYVWREVDDDPYDYELHAEWTGDGYTMLVYNLTSQRWLNGESSIMHIQPRLTTKCCVTLFPCACACVNSTSIRSRFGFSSMLLTPTLYASPDVSNVATMRSS